MTLEFDYETGVIKVWVLSIECVEKLVQEIRVINEWFPFVKE